jgi:hypothetical protein
MKIIIQNDLLEKITNFKTIQHSFFVGLIWVFPQDKLFYRKSI